jgi:hypothetical protein
MWAGAEAGVEGVTMLVTGDGEWLVPDTPEFFAALGDHDPDYDSVSFAVKNLGFIKFQIFGQSIAEIELHPRNVEMPALLAAQQQALSLQVKLFRLKFFDNEWRSEISSSAEEVIARLSALCAPQARPVAADRFVVEPQDFGRLFREDDNWLRPLAVKWRMSFGQFDATVISLAVAHGLLSRLVIVGITPGRGEPQWRFIGDGHKWIGSNYHLHGIGEQVQNMPDKDYGLWAQEYFKSTAASRQPRYDLVTGAIQYQDADGKPSVRRRYERLLLPWKTASAEVFVTSCSKGVDDVAEPAIAPPSILAKKFANSA